MLRLAVLIGIALALVLAIRYDARVRRRGGRGRSGREMTGESMHHRIDIDAVPYEPARHAGQRDWATYRARDRKSRPPH